jgi:hypothetical protein
MLLSKTPYTQDFYARKIRLFDVRIFGFSVTASACAGPTADEVFINRRINYEKV